MRSSPPPTTVDISAEPVKPFLPPVPRKKDLSDVIRQSLGVDVSLVFISLLMGVIFSSAVGVAGNGLAPDSSIVMPPQWFVFLSCGAPSITCLFLDALSALSSPNVLPFARSRNQMNALYARRIHLFLLAFYFTAILVALCWSAPSMLLVSKLFVASVFAIALYALGQSIPSQRASFIVSGVLFLVFLVATQAFIVLTLKADSAREKQEALDGRPLSKDSPKRKSTSQ